VADPRTFEQGSDEWREVKLGKLSSSRMADAIARVKSGWGASRANYRAELVCERISGIPYDGYTNGYMERGQLVEPKAVRAYEFRVDVETQKTGFWPHPTIADFGASPDRLVGTDGMVEAKCRTTAIHFELLLTHKIPDKFMVQVQTGLSCAERIWCDFISFDPRAPAGMDLFVKRIYRDERRIAELEREGRIFLEEVAEQTEALRRRAEAGFIYIHQMPGDGNLEAQLSKSLRLVQK